MYKFEDRGYNDEFYRKCTVVCNFVFSGVVSVLTTAWAGLPGQHPQPARDAERPDHAGTPPGGLRTPTRTLPSTLSVSQAFVIIYEHENDLFCIGCTLFLFSSREGVIQCYTCIILNLNIFPPFLVFKR